MGPTISKICFTVYAIVMFVSLSCISRNNPFDPVNRPALIPGSKIIVADADTLSAKIFSASAGDTIVVAPGAYHVSLRFANNGTPDKPIVVIGSDSGSVLRAQPTLGILYLSAQHSIRFQRMTFDSSNASGAKIENGCTDIIYSDCVFMDNAFDGLEITDSDVRTSHCMFVRNGKAGIRINGDASGSHLVTVINALLAHNVQDGMTITAAPVDVSHSTISDNGGNGIAITTPAGTVGIRTSIISFNTGDGISGLWDAAAAQLSLDSLDIVSNQAALSLTPAVSPAYWTWDPMFPDRNAGDYSIGSASEIYRLEQQGTVIGYRK
jgi:hypothetical protein